MADDTSTFELRWPWSAAATFVGVMWIVYAWSVWVGGGIDDRTAGIMMGSLRGTGYFVAGAVDSTAIIEDHEWERLVSGIFLHGGFLHIIMNSAAILQLGRILELFTTRGRCWFTLLLSGLFGSLATVVWAEVTGTRGQAIGASGAGCGLGAALIVLSRGVHALTEFRKQMTTWIIVMLGMGLLPMISGTGHAGGAIGGFVAGAIIRQRGSMRVANDRYSTGLDLATKLLTLVFVAALALNAWRAMERKSADAEVASAVSDVYSWLNEEQLPDTREWAARFRGLDLPTRLDVERRAVLELVDRLQTLDGGRLSEGLAEAARAKLARIRRE